MARGPLQDAYLKTRRFFGGLAGQMLALSMIGVATADALLLGPSLGNFHDTWIRERVDAAQIAALAMEAAPQDRLAETLERELLANAQVTEVALHRADRRVLTLQSSLPAHATMRIVDLRQARTFASILDGVSMLTAPRGRYARILAEPRFESGRLIEVVLNEDNLRGEIRAHARRAFTEALVVSLLVGAMLYGALFALVVRRIHRMTTAIRTFGKRPEDASAQPSGPWGDDELGSAEEALARMSEEVRSALRQKERLAALGGAVARIAHDLRNSLAAAQLVSERLAGSDDPKVRQSAPRLERAIARAAALAEAALRYGRAEEAQPVLQSMALAPALDEAASDALARHPQVAWVNTVGAASVRADVDGVHRIFTNLIRNAAEAAVRPDAKVVATARCEDGVWRIDIADNGPGIPEGLRARLFEPFATSQRPNGSGLGLAIARELARAMGGDVALAPGEAGACFRVTLPAA